MEDDGTGEAGRYNVQFVSTDCVKDWVEGRHEAQVSVVRLLHCGSFPGIGSLQTLLIIESRPGEKNKTPKAPSPDVVCTRIIEIPPLRIPWHDPSGPIDPVQKPKIMTRGG